MTADLNGDGEVSYLDLVHLISQWGVCEDCGADLTGDLVVDVVGTVVEDGGVRHPILAQQHDQQMDLVVAGESRNAEVTLLRYSHPPVIRHSRQCQHGR